MVLPSSPHTVSAPAQALLLAAGRGERMRPLTDATPKPLLPVQGKPLLRWQVDALARGGFTRLVVNTAWLGQQIPEHFGPHPVSDAGRPLSISYSMEGLDFGGALETAGGIARALPLLDTVFWAVAGDVFMPEFQFSPQALERFAASTHLAHLWLVPNPAHNPQGDFGLAADPASPGQGLALDDAPVRYTFSTVALYRHALFAPPWCEIAHGNPQGQAAKLAPLLRRAMQAGRVSAELYTGPWTDVGTPERLAALNAKPPTMNP